MGSTQIDYRGKGFQANDSEMEIWLALLVQEIDSTPTAPDWLREVREEWEIQARSGFGYGVMPQLDRFASDEPRREQLVALARRALVRLRALGDIIPRDTLNAFHTGGPDATFTQDASAAPFRRTGEYFLKLLEGTLTPAERDARFSPPPTG
jgi:hypothetical protein